MGDTVEALPQVDPRWEKRARLAARGFSPDPLPLGRLYVLAEGTAHQIEPLPPEEAFVELVRQSRAARFLGATGTTALHFRQCASLTNKVPICRLKRRLSLAELPQLATLVEEDIANLSLEVPGVDTRLEAAGCL